MIRELVIRNMDTILAERVLREAGIRFYEKHATQDDTLELAMFQILEHKDYANGTSQAKRRNNP